MDERRTRRVLGLARAAVAASVVLAGCTGSFDGGPALAPGVTPPGTTACDAPAPPSAPMRHLGRVEIDNSLRDLLHVTSTPAMTYAPDDSTIGFEVGAAVSDRLEIIERVPE